MTVGEALARAASHLAKAGLIEAQHNRRGRSMLDWTDDDSTQVWSPRGIAAAAHAQAAWAWASLAIDLHRVSRKMGCTIRECNVCAETYEM